MKFLLPFTVVKCYNGQDCVKKSLKVTIHSNH